MPENSLRSQSPESGSRKRRRSLKACDSCRKMKERCEGGVPCSRCVRLRRSCQFQMTTNVVDDIPQTRSEAQLGDSERLMCLEQILKHYIGTVPSDIEELRALAKSFEIPKILDSVDEEEDFDQPAINDESFTVKKISDNAAYYSGELSYWNFSKRVQNEIVGIERNKDQDHLNNENEYHRARHLQTSELFSPTKGFPPQSVAKFLVLTFFKYGQSNYFYVEEEWAMAKLKHLYTQTIGGSDDSPVRCILLMLLAIGTQYVDLDSTENSENDSEAEDDVSITLYRSAVQLIPDVLAIASLESVQACALLGVYCLPLDTSGLAYTYLGLAIKMAIQNGMHRKYTALSLDQHALEVRKRLWWTVYTLEKRICILHGRPLSILSSDVDADLPSDIDDFKPRNFTNLRAIIMLTIHLEAVASTIKQLRISTKNLQLERLDELVRQSQSLKNSWSLLPPEINCKDLDPQNSLFRANIHLNLAFLLTQVFMGRLFLFARNKTPTALESSKSKAAMAQSALASDCIQAAYRIHDLCQLIHDYGGLARASYIEFSACRAALLVFLTHSLNGNTKRLRNALTNGMNMMRRMTRGMHLAQSEYATIELLEKALTRLNARTEISVHQQQLSGYEKFRNWAQLWKQKSPQALHHSAEMNQQSLETPSTQLMDFAWLPMETDTSFALDPFNVYTEPRGAGSVSQSAEGLLQANYFILPEWNSDPSWMGHQM